MAYRSILTLLDDTAECPTRTRAAQGDDLASLHEPEGQRSGH
jgi:hypothetical protein